MKIWSDVEYVYRCLADLDRTRAFEQALALTVKPGSVVLDLGTGSGIMAMFAARAGARIVYAVEIGDYLFRASQQVFQDNGFAAQIIPLRMDARDVTLDCVEQPDVVVCEMVTSGLIGEMQGPVINSLKQSRVIVPATVLLPAALTLKGTLVQADYLLFGFDLRFPRFAGYFGGSLDCHAEPLSPQMVLQTIDLSEPFSEAIQVAVPFRISQAGRVNGLRLESSTDLVRNVQLADCASYCQPVIIPLRDLGVANGDWVMLTLRYQMGCGFDNLECSVNRSE